MIRIGVIGLTFGRAVHIPALKLDSRVKVMAVCSPSPRASQAASELGISKHYNDWRELIADKTIDAVTIATPPAVQALILPEALKARKHVFCEKPMGLNSTQTLEMSNLAEKYRLANMVDFEFPELVTWKRVKSEVARLGEVKLVLANWQVQASGYKEKTSTWKIAPESGGGTLRYLGCHSLYYLEWLFGPIADVSAQLSRGGEIVRAQLNLKSGGAIELCVGGNTPGTTLHRLEIWSERARLLLENTTADYMKGFVLTDLTVRPHESAGGDSKPAILSIEPASTVDGRVTSVGGVLKKFVDWIETGTPQTPSLREGARVEHLMECIEKSNSLKRVVET